jgi:endo-1,4-beta-xylanase
MRRRDFTKTLLAAAFSKLAWSAENESVRLQDLAEKRGLLAGSAVSSRELQKPDFTELLAQEASIVVAENDMKWRRIHPEPDRYDFSGGDALLAFATEHGQKLRGHNLCWHENNPEWLARVATRENAADLLRGHITEVAGHFAGHIHSWDVVNEAVAVQDGRPDGLRNSIWLELIGPEYIEIAFRAARAADADALLTYNDYDLEQDSPENERKRGAVLGLLRSLVERQAPIQALGLQSHLHAGRLAPTWRGMHRFLKKVEGLGLQVFVTELDVDDRELPADVKTRDRVVAEFYRDYLSNVLRRRAVKAVLTWGLTDSDTWLNHEEPRADGLPQRPLPFDAQLRAKPAFLAMQRAITKRKVRMPS